MFWERVRNITLAVVLGLGLIGFGVHRWVWAADGPTKNHAASAQASEDNEGQPERAKPGPVARRREIVIRLPVGTFVKEVEVAPYGHGRLTWTYEDERVLGHIEGAVMGAEFDLTTEAEYSLSSNGTIYGVLTSVRLTHLKMPEGQEWEHLKPIASLWQAAEPLVNEFMIDMPFSYRFRVQGDRLVISNFRMLLAGPNPLGKLGALGTGKGDAPFEILACFQALGTAIEGTYTAGEARDSQPARRSNHRSSARPAPYFGGRSRK